jgi:hypothetical protein
MYNNPRKILYFIYGAYLTISACANMVTPTGGLKDIEPPQVLKSKPTNKSTNFNQKNIEITFDEYINLKDIQNQFIISPSNIEANIRKDGKKLKIELSDLPKENTTYILNFGDAISDYTENNVSKDFKFIFSTAETIDSLSISGNILDAFKLEPIKDVMICLYTTINNDSIVYKQKPDYTVRTDESGNFKFSNLKRNSYKIFAIKEENNNKVFDSQDEQIAFIDTIIKLEKNTQLSNLKLFQEIPKVKKLKSKNINYQKVELIYNKQNNATLINLHPKIDTVIYSENKDTITVYYTENADSTALYISEDHKTDTIQIKFAKSLKKSNLNISIDPKIINNVVRISANDLFTVVKKDSISLYEDSIKVIFKLERVSHNKYDLVYNFNTEKKYYLTICDSAFRSFQYNYNKKLSQNLNFINAEDYGNLTISPLEDLTIIYELLNEKNEVVKRTMSTNKVIIYTNLNPGTYRIRMIYDSNGNKKWDTGNYVTKKQAERVEYYAKSIKIRANWDLEIVLIP